MGKIPFNKPYLSGDELKYIANCMRKGQTSGNRYYTQKCQEFFERELGFGKNLLTTSCTDALEMAALLCQINQGDEVIIPSFTFVSTANAFLLRGARIRFVESTSINPNMDTSLIEELINENTRAIVVVHYAGIACDMDAVMSIAQKYGLRVIEDAAQGISSSYKDIPLGTIGDLGTLSFHETKNIIAGEGGLLCINRQEFVARSEIIWEKGTNRAAFYRGEIDKYGWVDIGSSFLPSDLTAAFLFAQLENISAIQSRRLEHWNFYRKALAGLSSIGVTLPYIPDFASNNGHMFYLVCRSLDERSALIARMKRLEISCVFHYQALHLSSFFKDSHDGRSLPNVERYSNCLVRLPLYVELKESDLNRICGVVLDFYAAR